MFSQLWIILSASVHVDPGWRACVVSVRGIHRLLLKIHDCKILRVWAAVKSSLYMPDSVNIYMHLCSMPSPEPDVMLSLLNGLTLTTGWDRKEWTAEEAMQKVCQIDVNMNNNNKSENVLFSAFWDFPASMHVIGLDCCTFLLGSLHHFFVLPSVSHIVQGICGCRYSWAWATTLGVMLTLDCSLLHVTIYSQY